MGFKQEYGLSSQLHRPLQGIHQHSCAFTCSVVFSFHNSENPTFPSLYRVIALDPETPLEAIADAMEQHCSSRHSDDGTSAIALSLVLQNAIALQNMRGKLHIEERMLFRGLQV